MKLYIKLAITLFSALVLVSVVDAKGITYKIVLSGDDLAEPLIVSKDEIVRQFSIWAGPNSRSRTRGGEWQADYNGAFIDFEAGLAQQRPKGLVVLDVEFHLMDSPSGGYWDEAYTVKYALHPEKDVGFFYLPTGRPYVNESYILHGVEGNWLHSSNLWETLVAPLVRERLFERD